MIAALILITIITATIPSYSQLRVDSIFIYKNFSGGGSTSKLLYNFQYLDSVTANKIKMDSSDLNILKAVFAGSKQKKYNQQKHEGKPYYTVVWRNGKEYWYLIESSSTFGRMVNLTTMTQLKLFDSARKEKLYNMIREYK